jgi:hypothetical protein
MHTSLPPGQFCTAEYAKELRRRNRFVSRRRETTFPLGMEEKRRACLILEYPLCQMVVGAQGRELADRVQILADEWSNFDQQVGQVPLLYLLVTWPTCP